MQRGLSGRQHQEVGAEPFQYRAGLLRAPLRVEDGADAVTRGGAGEQLGEGGVVARAESEERAPDGSHGRSGGRNARRPAATAAARSVN
ncbi:hypothetical protein PQR15_03745 [Streptomyces lydicus]|nr:hypothetical protein [Streptomyces lydicus]